MFSIVKATSSSPVKVVVGRDNFEYLTRITMWEVEMFYFVTYTLHPSVIIMSLDRSFVKLFRLIIINLNIT